jgi:putative nucleotidyltransferase with HDIG domain
MFGSWKQNRWAPRKASRRLNGWTNGHRGLIPDRAALGKLAIGLLAAIVTIVVIDYGGVPFSYRVGQTSQRDIRSKVRFSLVNETRTERKRDQVAEAVPLAFQNNAAPVELLLTAADSLMEAVAAAESFELLPAAIAADWGVTAETFDLLHAASANPEATQSLAKSVRGALQAFQARGILEAEEIEQRPELRSGAKIRVVTEGAEPILCEVAEVVRPSILESGGALSQSLAQAMGSKELGDRLHAILKPRLEKLPATLTFDSTATDVARQSERDSVPVERDTFDAGARLVSQDQAITSEQLSILRAEHEAWGASDAGKLKRLLRIPSLTALVLGLFALAGYYIGRFERRVAASPTRVWLLGFLVVVTVGVAKRLHEFELRDLHGETIAIALSAMILAIAYSQQFAILTTFGLGLICAWMFGTGVNDFVVLTGGTAAAVLALNRVRSRTKLISVGATAAITYFALTWATGLLGALTPEMLLVDGLYRAMWGIMAGFLMGGSLPFLEKIFGIVTDINLLELSDVSHPLLLDLMRKAPGTYNHSVAVATLAETAAEQIDANPLVCRVGSYFHDVGKMLKPQYFVENQTDSVSRHEALNPAMSTLIIIGHVKDGADLAHEHHLPQVIVDLIEQHHGTTLVEYFYQEAAREVEENVEDEADVDEAAFRYPGPKPQSKEACILMLADAVESASRTLSEPTPGRIEGLVHELTLKRLLDGQFDECGVTLQEIGRIKESLIKSVNAIYHGRVKYPEQRTA